MFCATKYCSEAVIFISRLTRPPLSMLSFRNVNTGPHLRRPGHLREVVKHGPAEVRHIAVVEPANLHRVDPERRREAAVVILGSVVSVEL